MGSRGWERGAEGWERGAEGWERARTDLHRKPTGRGRVSRYTLWPCARLLSLATTDKGAICINVSQVEKALMGFAGICEVTVEAWLLA